MLNFKFDGLNTLYWSKNEEKCQIITGLMYLIGVIYDSLITNEQKLV